MSVGGRRLLNGLHGWLGPFLDKHWVNIVLHSGDLECHWAPAWIMQPGGKSLAIPPIPKVAARYADRYLQDALERLPTQRANRLDELLRHRWRC
jgi:hypothetical protein